MLMGTLKEKYTTKKPSAIITSTDIDGKPKVTLVYDNPVQTLIDNKIDFCIIGGYCRYLLGIEDSYKDIDIVTNTDKDLWKLFPNVNKNHYGGLELPMHNIWDIKNNVIPCKTFDELYENYFISYDALMYNPYQDKWWKYHFTENLIDINVNLINNQKHELNIEKIRKLAYKGLNVSSRAFTYCYAYG